MKMCSIPTPPVVIPRPMQQLQPQQIQQQPNAGSVSSSSSDGNSGQAAKGDNCWTLGPPICTEAKGPELYPILFEPPKRRIFGKMATNPFTKPANTQPPEKELSHVARWLDTIRLDDIEEYQEPFPEPYDDCNGVEGTSSFPDAVRDN